MSVTLLAPGQVYAIAEEVFSALVDEEEGMLQQWSGPAIPFVDPVAAWVDLSAGWTGRAILITEASTADDLARALLRMPRDEELTPEDLVDAFGEVANVVGGNIKSMVTTTGALSLPSVGPVPPEAPGATLVEELLLSWRGRLITVHVLLGT